MRRILAAILVLASIAAAATSRGATFVYCSAAQDKELAVFQIDDKNGELTPVERVKTPGEFGALCTSPDGTRLFAAIRSEGNLASFRIDAKSGRVTAASVIPAGADPAQISTDRTGRYLFTAYYVAGKVSVHKVAEDGTLSELPVQEIATAEKAHAIVPDATNRFVFVPHTGPSAIFQFTWNEKTNRLAPQKTAKLLRPEKSGPRHLAWHPKLPIAYIDNEQGSSVTAYRLGTDGSLEPGETAPTLPAEFKATNSTAEIKAHPSGKYLYVSNRGHDSLAVVEIDELGEKLNLVATEPTEKTPRSFDIDASGKFLLAAGESSGKLAVSRIDTESGRLKSLRTYDVGPKLWWVQTVTIRK